MPIPNLRHPVPVKLEEISRATTFYDDDTREPIQHAARKAVKTVPGQVKWEAQLGLEPGKVGPSEGSRGYVLFRRVDLDAQSVVLEDNDRILQIGDIDTDVYITRLEWVGHYPDIGGPTMVKAYFADRQPSKQSRG